MTAPDNISLRDGASARPKVSDKSREGDVYDACRTILDTFAKKYSTLIILGLIMVAMQITLLVITQQSQHEPDDASIAKKIARRLANTTISTVEKIIKERMGEQNGFHWVAQHIVDTVASARAEENNITFSG
jgi:hypothetical protein